MKALLDDELYVFDLNVSSFRALRKVKGLFACLRPVASTGSATEILIFVMLHTTKSKVYCGC